MTRDYKIENEAVDKALEKGDVQALLNMLPSDIQERGLWDALVLAEASEISTLSPEKRLDLLGQAIFIAYLFREDLEDYKRLLDHSGYLAGQQLLKKMESLGMNPDLLDNPVGVIARLYSKPDALYNNQKLEALRISQVYFYYYLYNIDHFPPEEQDDLRAYTVALGTLAVGFADDAMCSFECLIMAEIAFNVSEDIDVDRWLKTKPEGTGHGMRDILHDMALKAVKAARELHQDPKAAKWAGIADTLSRSLTKIGDRRSFLSERADLLLALGKAEKTLKTFEKIKNDPILANREIKDVIRKEQSAKFKISGDWESGLSAAFAEGLSINEIGAFKQMFDKAASGSANQVDFAALVNLIEKAMSCAPDAADLTNLFMLLKVLIAKEKGDMNHLLRQLPRVEQLARSDSLHRLFAAFLLIYLRQDRGESITWQSLAPLANRLFDLSPMLFFGSLSLLALILYKMDNEELVKGAGLLDDLIQRVSFDDDTERTPLANLNQAALGMPIIDLLLALLVKIAKHVPAEANLWLERAARLKYFTTYRVQKQQKEVKLFNYARELSLVDVQRVNQLVEALTRNSLVTLGKGGGGKLKEETQLKALLFPIYSRYRLSYHSTRLDFRYPEIIHAEVASMPGEANVPPLISIVYKDDGWLTDTAKNSLNRNDVKKFMEFIRDPYDLIKKYNNMNSISAGVRLMKALIPLVDKSASFPIIGVRSTGVYHNIPLDSLPMEVDETAGSVTRWIGEEMVSVLLTGRNQELGVLHKRISINNIALFANSSFSGIHLRDLPGAKNEAESIQRIVETQSNASSVFYFGSRSNRQNFLKLSGANAPGILHIATHGIVNSKEPSSSCIVLSREDHRGNKVLAAVGYYDIMLMDLRKCDLVVLSACSTYEGKSIMGEGIMGLAWAFKAAGAKAVIGTRWPVNDESAVEFWRKFYENLLAGLPIGKAFQGTRLHIMKQEKWLHPFYWGVFQLIV